MTLAELVEKMDLEIRAGSENLGRTVTGGYVSDLLSDVIAGASEGDLWITLQIHQNIVAVAFLNNLAGICLVGGRDPDPDTIEKADEQGVPILVTQLPAYTMAGQLYEMGIGKN